jgi:hypothetical protein
MMMMMVVVFRMVDVMHTLCCTHQRNGGGGGDKGLCNDASLEMIIYCNFSFLISSLFFHFIPTIEVHA